MYEDSCIYYIVHYIVNFRNTNDLVGLHRADRNRCNDGREEKEIKEK